MGKLGGKGRERRSMEAKQKGRYRRDGHREARK